MATRERRSGSPRTKKPRSAYGADAKLESNQRMTWIEQGGIDLREARSKARATGRRK